ncbi:MAG TPA: hypothetical protein VMY76_04290, partial [Gemmatimonadales bacterium]|nr:hypothetical protein [Gemmatimonadales bacterium]
SAYAFVSRAGGVSVRSFDDPALRTLRIGVHFTGAGGNPPPAEALARRGLADRLVSFSIYGDYRDASPPARLIEAVSRGEVDVAVAWGPLAGYFAPRQSARLQVNALTEADGGPGLPMTFAIAMGVRPGDTARRDQLQRVLDRRAADIRRLLQRYGVPLLEPLAGAGTR